MLERVTADIAWEFSGLGYLNWEGPCSLSGELEQDGLLSVAWTGDKLRSASWPSEVTAEMLGVPAGACKREEVLFEAVGVSCVAIRDSVGGS